ARGAGGARGKGDDLLSVNTGKGVRHDNQATACILTECAHDAFDFGWIINECASGLHPKRWSRSLERAQETRPIRSSGRVEHQRDTDQAWRDRLEQVKPFSAHRVLEAREAGHVAARMRETRDNTLAEWIGDPDENDWCALCFLLQGSHRARPTR